MIATMLDAYSEWLPRHAAGLIERFSEVLSILSQAASAAHHYEKLRRQCNAALAQQGLKRADLPRIAHYELTQRVSPERLVAPSHRAIFAQSSRREGG